MMSSDNGGGNSPYDSRPDTIAHIEQVRVNLRQMINDLQARLDEHDTSKLFWPEKELFDEYTPLLKGLTYGSDEYNECLNGLKPALDHHYAVNDHHPEHYENGINDMNLMALMEMLADWYAATKRHKDGDLGNSLYVNSQRFNIDERLLRVLWTTAKDLGWIDEQ